MQQHLERLIDLALEEDLGCGDITTEPIVPREQSGTGRFVSKEWQVVAGSHVVEMVFRKLDPEMAFVWKKNDGEIAEPGEVIATFNGNLRALLVGERTALNFMQRLSGIATNVRNFLAPLEDSGVLLVDTRKTTPGFRALEKEAVRIGGAHNHRMGLYDGVMIKDNHIAAAGSIEAAAAAVRSRVSHLVKIEVETTTLAEVEEALAARADIIMLDNMDVATMTEACALIAGRALVEASGNVTADRLKALSSCGVDIVSAGALTHQAKSVDISMRID